MLVFWRERLVLLSVPKTGTTAVEGALAPRAAVVLRDPPQLKHATLQRFARHVAPLLAVGGAEGFETVACVREPVSWLGSWFRYRGRDDVAGHRNSTRGRSFDEFVDEWLRDRPAPWAAVGTQSRFVFGPHGARATHVFRHEDQGRYLGFLADRLGPLPPISRLNVSPDGELALDPGLARRLRDERPAEFAAWEAGAP